MKSIDLNHRRRSYALVAIVAMIVFSAPPRRASAAIGDLDPGFGKAGKVITHLGFGDRVSALAIQTDGKIIAAGTSAGSGMFSAEDFALVRYNTDGSLDSSFGADGKVISDFQGQQDQIDAIALQPDGKIVVAGRSNVPFALTRYTSDGKLDFGFGSSGRAFIPGFGADGHALAIQPDGKIIVAGNTFTGPTEVDFALARFNSDGSVDSTFGNGGKVSTDFGNFDIIKSMAIQPDGKIVAGGLTINKDTNTDFALVRYNKDGSLDSTFGSGGTTVTDFARFPDALAAVALQADGKIVAAGGIFTFLDPSRSDPGIGVVRYNTNGSLDSSFGSGGKVVTQDNVIGADAVAVQRNGKIIAAGLAKGGDFGVVRYNANGSLDSSFGTKGVVTTDFASSGGERAFALAIQKDGRIVAAGSAFDQVTGSAFALARYLVAGFSNKTFDMHLQKDGSLLQFDSETGDYSFTDCASGFTLEGTGTIKLKGCKLILRDGSNEFDLSAKINLCTNSGKSSIQLFSQGLFFNVKDGDITSSISECK